LLSAGALDTTFGGTGVVATSLSKGGDNAYTSLLQPNGDIVTAGTTVSGSHKTPSFALVARKPDGSLDTAFGSSGKVITANSDNAGANLAAAQYASTDTTGNANKIVLVGNGNSGITLARYNANGTLDTTFGTKGMVTTALNGGELSMAIQPADGKIVVAGWYNEGSYNQAFVVLRYNANGSLDSTFGSNGEVITNPVTGHDNSINMVLVQPDGKILGGGAADYDLYTFPDGTTRVYSEFTLVRYNSDGSLDSTFGSGGIVHTLWPGTGNGSGGINSLALQSNGQIVAVGVASPSNPGSTAWALARYNSDGTLDSTFGTGGLVTLDTSISYDFHNHGAGSVALQSNGELVVLGGASDANLNSTFAVVTLTATGSLDTAFGGTGWVLGTDNSATSSIGIINLANNSVLVQPSDGKIVVTGVRPDSSKQNANDFAVDRYIGTTTLARIGSLTANPEPVASGSSTALTASSITDGNAGANITQVTFYYFDTSGNKVTLGNAIQTSAGLWTQTSTNTFGVTAGSYSMDAQAEAGQDIFGDPFAIMPTVQ
jgi:uncharacterized delta-60 repeat protein